MAQNASHLNYASHYSRRGERVTHRIASAVARKSWYWTLLNLAWTVGPVTFLALQFGHYLGFGSQASVQHFYYFAGYTLIAGACAWIASIVYEAIYQPRINTEQEQLLEAIDRLHTATLLCTDEILRQLDMPARKIMSAYYILQSVGASPSAVEASVYDLTNSSELTFLARRAKVYSEQGMQSRVEDIFALAKPHLDAVREELAQIAPLTTKMLEGRLKGIEPSVRLGIERSDGFIERTLTASEMNDMHALTLYDVKEILTLTLELLNGRKIALLDARLKGDSDFEKAQMQLDEARHHYRITLRKRNSQTRLLAERLYVQTDMELVAEATDTTALIVEAIEPQILGLSHAQRQGHRKAYERVYALNQQLSVAHARMLKAEQVYTKYWRKYGKKLSLAMQKNDLAASGFYIEERDIALNDKQKLRVASVLHALFEDAPKPYSTDSFKHIATELASELDELIDMSQPEEQLAIESSNAADFGHITAELAPKTKAGRAAIAVEAMHENRRKASHRLARSLIAFYRLPLTDSIIGLFVEQFGADEMYLRELNVTFGKNADERDAAFPDPPPNITPWRKLVAAM